MSKNYIYKEFGLKNVNSRNSQIRKIHEAIINYCADNHKFNFDINNPIIRLHEPTFSHEEIIAALNILLSTKVTMGTEVREFENEFSKNYGHKFGVSSNSGSSANLLAVAALSNVETEQRLRPGDEIIVSALSWSTTVWPLVQHNLVPVIVDIDPNTLNIDLNSLESAITKKTKAIMPVHVYGNPCDMDGILSLCRKYDLRLIEDCCEALGASYRDTPVGKFGDIGTFSFYFSHHITTLEGGICITSNHELSETMKILRAHGWIREIDNKERYIKMYPEFDPRFLFVNQGYNLRITELQGAMGRVQLSKLDDFVQLRRGTTAKLKKTLAKWKEFFDFQEEQQNGYSSCFGFPLIIKDTAPFSVHQISNFLNDKAIETRPIICGNIASQPAMKLFSHRVSGSLENSNHIMKNGFSIGNHQYIDDIAITYLQEMFNIFLNKYN